MKVVICGLDLEVVYLSVSEGLPWDIDDVFLKVLPKLIKLIDFSLLRHNTAHIQTVLAKLFRRVTEIIADRTFVIVEKE